MRPDPFGAGGEEDFAVGGKIAGLGDVQDILAVFPIAGADHIVRLAKRGGAVAEQRFDLGARPDVEFAFDPFAVGIFRRIKSARQAGQVAQHVVARPARDVGKKCKAGNLVGVHIAVDELRLVVKHLFEMRDEPAGVHAVAMKAAAELIEQSAFAHFAECA